MRYGPRLNKIPKKGRGLEDGNPKRGKRETPKTQGKWQNTHQKKGGVEDIMFVSCFILLLSIAGWHTETVIGVRIRIRRIRIYLLCLGRIKRRL